MPVFLYVKACVWVCGCEVGAEWVYSGTVEVGRCIVKAQHHISKVTTTVWDDKRLNDCANERYIDQHAVAIGERVYRHAIVIGNA